MSTVDTLCLLFSLVILATTLILPVTYKMHKRQNNELETMKELTKNIAELEKEKMQNERRNHKSEITNERSKNEIFRLKVLSSLIGIHFFSNLITSFKTEIIKAATEKKRIELAGKLSELYDILKTLLRDDDSSNTYNLITIKDEIDITKKYVSLELLRNSNIDVKYKYDGLEMVKIPMLSVQTYVNNAIQHGFESRREIKGEINVEIKQKEESIVIIIVDNGIGLVESKKISDQKTYDKNRGRGLAYLAESYAFIKKGTQQDCCHEIVEIKDNNGKVEGTKVTVTIPIF